jgi:hypothetical protein
MSTSSPAHSDGYMSTRSSVGNSSAHPYSRPASSRPNGKREFKNSTRRTGGEELSPASFTWWDRPDRRGWHTVLAEARKAVHIITIMEMFPTMEPSCARSLIEEAVAKYTSTHPEGPEKGKHWRFVLESLSTSSLSLDFTIDDNMCAMMKTSVTTFRSNDRASALKIVQAKIKRGTGYGIDAKNGNPVDVQKLVKIYLGTGWPFLNDVSEDVRYQMA